MKEPTKLKLWASNADVWTVCTAQPELVKDMTSPSTPQADEGTCAHALAEKVFKSPPAARWYLTNNRHPGANIEMADHVQNYVDYVRLSATKNGTNPKRFGLIKTEEKLKVKILSREITVKADNQILAPDEFHIFDFKYGKSPVSAKQNKQLMLGALALMDQHDGQKITGHIFQPRVYKTTPQRTWDIPLKELKKFKDVMKRAVEKIDSGKTEFVRNDGCFFCPANQNQECPLIYGPKENPKDVFKKSSKRKIGGVESLW